MATPTTLPASFTSGQVLTAAQMNNLRGAFRILQVVQDTKLDTFTTTSTTYTDVTGLSVSITPSSTSSLVLVFADVKITGLSVATFMQIVRDSTAIYIGDAGTTQSRCTWGSNNETGDPDRTLFATGSMFLDTPNTTSATTYKVQVRQQTSGTCYINRNRYDDSASHPRAASSITVMEVSA